MINLFVNFSYLLANTLMIFAIKMLATPQTARKGNIIGIIGIFWAIAAAFVSLNLADYTTPIMIIFLGAIAGIYVAFKSKITALPQIVAVFNAFGGLSSVCISLSEVISQSINPISNVLSLIIGGIAFSGSIIAFAKLQYPPFSKAIHFRFQYIINLLVGLIMIALAICFIIKCKEISFYFLVIATFALGVLLILPVGGADIPVIISCLNACSGWAGVFVGISLQSPVLIVIGTIVGASGTFLAYIMTKSLNRSLLNILSGGLFTNNKNDDASQDAPQRIANVGSPADAAFLMQNSSKIIIVPGFGMAAAHAQYALKSMADILHQKYNVEVKFAIHPVAGRMPGHMNVLLAEANIDYKDVFELDEINPDFQNADVAYIIGANDITNPKAKTDPSSPIYGMPILEVEKAKTVFFVKRSLNTGYSNVENPLFYAPNTFMLYGDAAQITETIVKYLNA